jgi:hypothetical protein
MGAYGAGPTRTPGGSSCAPPVYNQYSEPALLTCSSSVPPLGRTCCVAASKSRRRPLLVWGSTASHPLRPWATVGSGIEPGTALKVGLPKTATAEAFRVLRLPAVVPALSSYTQSVTGDRTVIEGEQRL